MPSKKQYNLVHDDAYDSRIPLHSEEAFQHGINFQAKYIGTLDVPRPSSRVEIVAAMRRIRYEFKAKAIKKKKVNIIVSVDGVKIVNRKKKKSQWMEDKAIVMHHPIYRIFYVSHDSQDLKIFSYIARDGASNVFKCNVFKSNKKSQAMRIVRTVGQAFEVCHKLSLHHSQQTVDGQEDAISERSSDVIINAEKNRKLKFPADGASEPNSCDTQTEEIPLQDPALQQQQQLIPDTSVGSVSASTSVSTPTTVSAAGNLQRPNRLEPIPPPPDSDSNRGAPLTEGETYSSPMSKPLPAFDSLPNAGTPLSTHHQVQLLREQLDQQQQQTQVAIAQIHLLRDQLAAETAARLEVQARIHQLLVHNRELLDHIHRLVLQMQEMEAKTQGLENKTSPQRFQQQMQEYNYLTQIPITTPSSAPTSFPDYQSLVDPNQAINSLSADQSSLYENHNPSISGLEPPTSPLQMCNSPVPSYGSGGVTPLHYSGSLNRSPSLRIQQQQQQQQSHTPPINANEQLRQVLSNNNNFYQQQRTGNYYRSPPNTAPSAMLRQMQQTTPNEELDQRYKMALAQQDSGGNRMDLSYLDNYSLPMPKLNPPPQRKRPTSRQSSLVNQHGSGQSEDALTPSDVNICNSNEDLLVKQRLQLANSFLMSEQVNKLLDSEKSASDVTQQTLIDLGNMNLNERNKQLQQQFFQSNGPGSYVMNPPRSAPSTLTTYMDDTNLERLGRMQRMTWTRHTVGK